MQKIILDDINLDFVTDGEKRGYRPYVDVFRARDNETTPGFYLGSIQKRVSDDAGLRYFISIDMFNMGVFKADLPDDFSARANVQFRVDEASDKTADVSFSFESFDETESFLGRMWREMKFGYSER